jgi:small subunit ribosomal protein S21
MSIRVKTRQGESVNQLMRRFKKLCEKEGLTKDIKRRAYFEKPSERRRRDQRKSVQRVTRVGAPPPPRAPRPKGR